MHATYGGITGNPDISVPVLPLPAISEPVIFPSVAFPPPVILSPCANAGVTVDVPAAVKVRAADTIAAAATNIVVIRILLFINSIIGVRTINYIIVIYASQSESILLSRAIVQLYSLFIE